jgi:hypothetical protein
MIIIDTGFFLALANQQDESHQRAKTKFQSLAKEKFITTWCVATETCYLLQERVGVEAPKLFINKISTGKLLLFDLKPIHWDFEWVFLPKLAGLHLFPKFLVRVGSGYGGVVDCRVPCNKVLTTAALIVTKDPVFD